MDHGVVGILRRLIAVCQDSEDLFRSAVLALDLRSKNAPSSSIGTASSEGPAVTRTRSSASLSRPMALHDMLRAGRSGSTQLRAMMQLTGDPRART